MFDFIGLLFIVGTILGLYRFFYNKHKAVNHVTEPTLEKAALHKKEVNLMSGKTLARHFGVN